MSPSRRRQSAIAGANSGLTCSPADRPSRLLRFNSIPEVFEYTSERAEPDEKSTNSNGAGSSQHDSTVAHSSTKHALAPTAPLVYRLLAVLVITAIVVPAMYLTTWLGRPPMPFLGARAGPLRRDAVPGRDVHGAISARQATSPVDTCSRWAHMTALVNGTLYVYGGQATTKEGQTADTWNNNLITLDLTKSWQITSAPFVGLPQPEGPPKVALGSLWHSYNSLFLYGGEYSSSPPAQPAPFSLWQYDIIGKNWIQHQNPRTSAGKSAPSDGEAVGGAAEGAGISVPALGRAWYFGGHQDGYTTPGWSQSIWRIYLTSLLEFTFPGSTNDQVTALQGGKAAGQDGTWRNITEGGAQESAGFSERADGILLHVPGYSAEGVLIGMAGGNNVSFQQMSQIDVYDIATSIWYKQATTGPTPPMRVNPCAVVASAPDGTSQNVYMFGGQNLNASGQAHYDDMWILTLPSFTWIKVDQSSQSVPLARAGHTCNIWNGQMVLVGGYLGQDVSCDSPGVYIYNLSSLQWQTSYTNLADLDPAASIQNNPLNQQLSQKSTATNADGNAKNAVGLEGSFGYTVPKAVQSVIGGGPDGGATVTAPAQVPTDGPMKTGRPVTYTVTAAGSRVTETTGAGTSNNSASRGNSTGAIVAGVIAGILAVTALYLAYCAWLYRRRMREYKRHVQMATRMSYDSYGEAPLFGHDNSLGYSAAVVAGAGAAAHNEKAGKDSTEGSAFIANSSTNDGYAASGHGSGSGRDSQYRGVAHGGATAGKSTDDLLAGGEPSFWGTMLSPRRSLRVTNRD